MAEIGRELRSALRSLARQPGHAVLATAILACGLGLTMYMFGAIEAYVLRPLPYHDSSHLYHVEYQRLKSPMGTLGVPMDDYLDLRDRQTSFKKLAAFRQGTVNLSGTARPERYDGVFVTSTAFDVIGATPALGRGFVASDCEPGAAPVVIIGHQVWLDRFAGDPGVIGSGTRVNSRAATIVGVMPKGFYFPVREQIWVPLTLDVTGTARGAGYRLDVIGRLWEGVSPAAARAELTTITAELASLYPETNSDLVPTVKTYAEEYVDQGTRTTLYTMFATVLLVLLVACANVANLTLVRTNGRRRELAIRSALGAGRLRLMLQVLTECLVISVAAAAVAVWLSTWGGKLTMAIIRSQENAPPTWVEISLRWPHFAFALAAALVTTVLAGALPALRASATDVNDSLRAGGRGLAGTPLGRLSRMLVVGEIGLACVVLVCAGLMVRSLVKLDARDLGADTASILTGRIGLFEGDYPDAADRSAFLTRLEARLGELPGVEAATLSTSLPGTMVNATYYTVEGRDVETGKRPPWTTYAAVSPSYLETFGIPVREGRGLTAADDARASQVVVVNSLMAKAVAEGGRAVGTRLRLGRPDDPDAVTVTIVGIVPDVNQDEVDEPLAPTIYRPIAQAPPRFVSLALRTTGDPMAQAEALRLAVNALDPNLPIYWVRTLDEWIDQGRFYARLLASLFAIFAAIGLLLAAAGLYAVLAYEVSQRGAEIGVRRALGATNERIVKLLLERGVLQLSVGLGIGIAIAVPFARLLSGELFGVAPWDPATFAVVVATIAAVALLAAVAPARRALSVDPADTLRWE